MKLFVVVLLLGGSADALVAQSSATATSEPIYAQHSPLVLETVFPLADPSAWRKIKSMQGFAPGRPINLAAWPAKLGKEISLPEWYALGRYTCDGVSLREEVTSHGREWKEPGLRIQELRVVPSGFEITLEATLYNPKTNGAKLVTVLAEVLGADDAVIATGSRIQRAPADSKSGNNADVVFLFARDEMKKAAKLRLTLSTKDY